ncbi:hypothetical protein [uncultured Oceanicoccus sp.]|uniref:hypothetical protein n=1 Tax=uncultured Oceanicoccus sp. TaxID=1706381 RepID=UPI0030DBF189
MWPAFVIALLSGLTIGYWVGRNTRSSSAFEAEHKLEEANLELDKARSTQKLLEQEVADLKYQLGEEKKARAYAEGHSKE